jgi:organic hydroperoxide reductase OsmC/OhrA
LVGLFHDAMRLAASKMRIGLPADAAVDAEVDLLTASDAYFLRARVNGSLPGLERDVAQTLVDAAHLTVPIPSNARQH